MLEKALCEEAIALNGREKVTTLRCIHCGLITLTSYKPLLKYWIKNNTTLRCRGTLFCEALTPYQQIKEAYKELEDFVNL